MRSQVDVSQVCSVLLDSAISQRESSPCLLYGTMPSGSSRWVFPQQRHSITLKQNRCILSPIRTFRVQVPWTLRDPPQIGHTLRSLLWIFITPPLQDRSNRATLIMSLFGRHRSSIMRSGLGVKIIPLPNRYCSYSFQNILLRERTGPRISPGPRQKVNENQ